MKTNNQENFAKDVLKETKEFNQTELEIIFETYTRELETKELALLTVKDVLAMWSVVKEDAFFEELQAGDIWEAMEKSNETSMFQTGENRILRDRF